jgi:hypothetical protein
MKKNLFVYIGICFLTIWVGCKKTESPNATASENEKTAIPDNFFAITKLPGIVNSMGSENGPSLTNSPQFPAPVDLNNGDEEMILGAQLPNPYTVANMQTALYILYGGSAPSITANHTYMRLKPNSPEQFEELEDNQDLELQDYPMDYEVVQDGDYYQDPTLGTEDYGWLYSVVPITYTPPPGIRYEIIAELYLTDNIVLEGIAESIAGGIIYSFSNNADGTVTITRQDNGSSITLRPPAPCELLPWDDIDYCGAPGGIGGGGGGIPLTPGIYVEEQQLCGTPTLTLPLIEGRVVAKRWFKVWRGYTNEDGRFTVTRRFRNGVKMLVKMRNNNARVAKIRGIRLWQMFFPVKKRMGIFNGNELNVIRYVFTKPTDGNARNKDLTYWTAATTHNAVMEFRQYVAEINLPVPPTKLKIMVSNWGDLRDVGAAPMWNKCHNNIVPTIWVSTFLIGGGIAGTIVGGIVGVATILKNRVDIIVGYTSADYNCLLTSIHLRSLVYHELGHAQHYTQVGCNFWTDYRNAITTEMSKTDQPEFHPYGTGNDGATAPIIATGEMWGNHIEKWLGERIYGGPTPVNIFSRMQGGIYVNNGSPTGNYLGNATITVPPLNANFGAIESFNPNEANDRWRWIPQGLPYDLWDNRNDVQPIIDNVNGYTINQCFTALQPDVRSIPAFRLRLLQQNGNVQALQVNQLFQQYGF